MTPALTLRPAKAADAATLADLGRRAFVAKFGHMYKPEDLANFLAESHVEEKVAKEIADPGMRVTLVEAEGRMLGFCKMVMACGWPEHARGKKVVELKQLYLDPDLTGRGLGAALTEEAIAAAREFGADEIQLSVWSGNEGAQKFYARYGFGRVADIHFMVGEQRDEEFLFAALL